MNDWDRFNDQFRETTEERNERLRSKRLMKAKCSHCNDTGMIAIRSRDGAYAFPGPVPDDAKGYADADCWYCDCAKARP